MSDTTLDVALESLDIHQLAERSSAAFQRAQKLKNEAKALTERAAIENRDLTAGDSERFDRLVRGAEKVMTEHNVYRDEWAKRFMAGVESGTYVTSDEYVARRSSSGHKDHLDTYTRPGMTEVRSQALRAIEADYASDDDRKQAATVLVERSKGDSFARYVSAVADPAYLRAWSKVFADPQLGFQRLDRDEADAMHLVRAMSVGTDNAGGFGTPLAIDPTMQITASAAAINPFASAVRTVNITTDKWRGLTTAGATASWDAEATQVSDDSPTLADTDITVHKLQVFVPASIEVTQDYPGFAAEIATVLSDAAARAEHTAIVSGAGNGSNQPVGFVTAIDGTSSEIAPTTAETFAVEDVYKLAEALPERYWPNARWAMARGTSFGIRQFADGTDEGQHAFWTDLGGGQPSLLIGQPVVISDQMDSTSAINAAATADNFVLAIADWQKAYTRVVRIGFNVELVPHLFGANGRPTGQRGYYGYLRLGGDVVDNNAIRLLSIPTAE